MSIHRRALSALLAASLVASSIPATAIALEREGATTHAESIDALMLGFEDDVPGTTAAQSGNSIADAKGGSEAVPDGTAEADGQTEGQEGAETAPMSPTEDETAEEQAATAWVRPTENVSLTANEMMSGSGTYPVMQACTSTRLKEGDDIASAIVAKKTAPANDALDFASEGGVSASALIAARGDMNVMVDGRGTYSYWKAKLLSAEDGYQVLTGNSNMTQQGADVERIRYNAGRVDADGKPAPSWEYAGAGAAWTAFKVGEGDGQLVFYYMQVAQADDNVMVSNDNWYHSRDAWEGYQANKYPGTVQDAVCFLYQIYDESGKKIAGLPPVEAYYYSHALDQQINVTLTDDLADKYEIADVRWDQYQGYTRGHYPMSDPFYEDKSSLYGFKTPESFIDLAVDPEGTAFTVGTASGLTDAQGNMRGGACPASTHSQACWNQHWGAYVIGVMVRGIQSDQTESMTVEYYGNPAAGSERPAVKLGGQTVAVADAGGYDWASSGYERATQEPTELSVTSAFRYGGNNVIQKVPLTLPEAYQGVYSDLPVSYELEGSVLKLYFAPETEGVTITSDPVAKVYDGTPLRPADPVVNVPDGFTCVIEDGALTGSQTDANEGDPAKPVLDMDKVHIYKGENGPEVTDAFDIVTKLGDVTVLQREIRITPADDEKTYGEADPIFAAPAIKLESPADGKPAIIKGDDLAVKAYRANDAEDVKRDAAGEVAPYEGVLQASYAANPNYKVTADTADFTIWPQSIDPSDKGKDPSEGRYLGVTADPLADIAYNGEDSTLKRMPVLTGKDGGELSAGDDYTSKRMGDTANVTDEGVTVTVTGTGNYTGTITIANVEGNGSYSYQITPIQAVIYVNDIVKHAGQADEDEAAGRVFGGTIEGLVKDDSLGSVTYSRTNAGEEEVGTYDDVLTAEVADANPNYRCIVVNGTLTILPEEEPAEPEDPAEPIVPEENSIILVGVTGKTYYGSNAMGGLGNIKTYDGEEMFATAVAEKPGSTLLYSTNNGNTWSETNPHFTNVGEYTVTIKATHPNYADTDAKSVDLTIKPRPVTIVADDASKKYGQDDPAFTGSIPRLVRQGDLGTVSFSRINGDEEVGTYPQVITASYTENPNYEVTVQRGTMDISPNDVLLQGIMGAGELIQDAATPLTSKFDGSDHSCWVHWWMFLGMLLTVIGAAASLIRRVRNTKLMRKAEDELLDDEAGRIPAHARS